MSISFFSLPDSTFAETLMFWIGELLSFSISFLSESDLTLPETKLLIQNQESKRFQIFSFAFLISNEKILLIWIVLSKASFNLFLTLFFGDLDLTLLFWFTVYKSFPLNLIWNSSLFSRSSCLSSLSCLDIYQHPFVRQLHLLELQPSQVIVYLLRLLDSRLVWLLSFAFLIAAYFLSKKGFKADEKTTFESLYCLMSLINSLSLI